LVANGSATSHLQERGKLKAKDGRCFSKGCATERRLALARDRNDDEKAISSKFFKFLRFAILCQHVVHLEKVQKTMRRDYPTGLCDSPFGIVPSAAADFSLFRLRAHL
jgi:hypothetical protein